MPRNAAQQMSIDDVLSSLLHLAFGGPKWEMLLLPLIALPRHPSMMHRRIGCDSSRRRHLSQVSLTRYPPRFSLSNWTRTEIGGSSSVSDLSFPQSHAVNSCLMRWVIKEVEPPPHDSAAEDRSAEMRLGSVTAAILRYDLVASPHVCLPDFSPVAVGIRSRGSCHSRHSPTHSGDGRGSFQAPNKTPFRLPSFCAF